MQNTRENAPSRDPNGLWATCPACKEEFSVPGLRVARFVEYVMLRQLLGSKMQR